MRCKYGMVLIGLFLAVSSWLVSAAFAFLDTEDKTFVEILITDVPNHALILRLITAALFIGLGIMGALLCRARQEASGSRRALEAMMDGAPTGMLLIAPDRTILRANAPICTMLGMEQDQVVGRRCTELMPGEECDTENCSVLVVMGGGTVTLKEVSIAAADGSETACLLSATPVPGPDGRPEAVLESFHDITERKRIQQALAESEQRYRSLVENARIGIIIIQDGNIRYVNQYAANSVGCQPEEMLDTDIGRYVADDMLDAMAQLHAERMKRAAAGEQVEPMEARTSILTADGTRLDVDMSGAVIAHEGRLAELVAIRDITATVRAQQALAESEQRYRTLVESAHIGIAIIAGGIVRYINTTAAGWIGHEPEQVVGTPVGRYLAPDVRDDMVRGHMERMERAISGEQVELLEAELGIVGVSGVRREVDTAGGMISYEGEPAEMIVLRDITEAHRARQALAAETERLRVTLRSLGEGVISVNMAGQVTLMNRTAEDLTGRPQSEALGRELAEVLDLRDEDLGEPLPSPVERVLGQAVARNGAEVALLVGKDGAERTVAVTTAPLYDPQSRVVGAVLVVRDVTVERIHDDQQRRLETLEAVGLLAGGIAHDFNNLLTGFFGNIGLARLAVETGDGLEERLDAAEKSLERARELTERLLTFASGGKPVRSPLRLDELLRQTVESVLEDAPDRYRLDIADDLWPIEADGGQLRQVFAHLVRNADEAMSGDGQVLVAARNVEIEPDDLVPLPAGEYVHISVHDSGPGIPREVMPRIFEPYFTTKPTGRGLGLPVAFSVARQHGGYVEAECRPGQGTVMHVYLPVTEAQVEEPQPHPRGEPCVAEVGPQRILIMDDEETIRSALAAMLESMGHEADGAAHGVEALAMYEQAMDVGRPYSLVIMDLTIPGGMGGKEAVGRLRRLDPQARVVVSSGYSTDPIMADYGEYGFDGVIAKPYRIREVREAIEIMLAAE